MVERQRAVGSLEGLEESSCQKGLVLLVWPTCVSQCLPFPWRHLLQVGGEAVVCPRAASTHNNHALHLRCTFSATDLRQREETGPPLQGGGETCSRCGRTPGELTVACPSTALIMKRSP